MEPAMKSVILADFAPVKYHMILQWLHRDGVHGEAFGDPGEFLQRLREGSFDLCVVNLVLGGMGPNELITSIREASANPDLKIVVISRQTHKLNIQNAIRAGASDFIAEPFENEALYQRILYHLSPKKIIDASGYEGFATSGESAAYLHLLLEANEIMCRTERGEEHGTFLAILQKVAESLGSNRTSLIVVEPESNTGVVLATSDDPNFHDFPISLHKYPEIQHVINSGCFVLIEDVSQNALTSRVNEKVRTILVGSLMVFPIRYQGEISGVLTVRRPKATDLPAMDVMRALQSLANTMAAYAGIKAILRRIAKDAASAPQQAFG